MAFILIFFTFVLAYVLDGFLEKRRNRKPTS